MIDIIKNYPVLSIIVVIVITAIVLVIVPKVIYKVKNRHVKIKETKNIKKDLMIWKRIAHLAMGGSASENAKNSITQSNLQLIELSFEKLKKSLKSDYKTINDVPWFIALGEPYSGKSTLLENSMQDLVATEKDDVDKDGTQKSALLRFWTGSSGIVADVSGKVFFDRWMEGSGAEWISIVKKIQKKHRDKALSGIILTIPADSLIADDESLTKRKAILIKKELNKMINIVGMHLPCYVVITKSDIISGFREYFEDIDDNIRKAALGWKSEKPYYDDNDFTKFWNEFIHNLRRGRNSLLLQSDVFYTNSEHGRIDKASSLFLLPESINDLSNNLEIYMKTIFSTIKVNNFYPSLILDGVYFTSASDSGYTLNKFFAKMQNKKIDDAPISEPPVSKKGFFIADLFSKNIFYNKDLATYTSKEIIRHNIKHYAALGSMVALSLIWVLATIFNGDNITEKINSNLSFYNETSDIFANKSINQAYLISLNENGKPVYNGDSVMPHDPLLYRQSYYITALKDVQTEIKAPFGFYAASLLRFGSLNMDIDNRLYLFELIHSRLVTFPLIRSIEEVIINQKDEPFTLDKREVFISLLHFMDEKQHYSMEDERQKVQIMIKYLFPDMHDEIIRLLVAKNYYSKRDYQMINESVILYPSYFKAIQTGMKQILDGWNSGKIYPNSEYNLEKSLLYAVNTVDSMINNTKNFKDNDDYSNLEALTTYNRLWLQIYNNITSNIMVINDAMQKIKANKPEFIGEKSDKMFVALVASSYKDYLKLFNEDFDLINTYNNRAGVDKKITLRDFIDSVEINNTKENAIANLENEFNKIQTAATKNLSNLFTNIEIDKTSISYYNLIFALYNIAFNRPVGKVNANIDSFSVINKYNNTVKNNSELLIKYEDALKSNDNFTKLMPFLRKMHSHTYQYNNIVFISDMLNRFPETELDLMVEISSNYGENMNIPLPKAKYVTPVIKTEYNSRVLDEYVNPFWNSLSAVKSTLQNDEVNYLSYYLSNDERYNELYNSMSNYTSAFIRYWGTFGDSLVPSLYNYSKFHSFITGLQPYVVNNELYMMYGTAKKILNAMPENIMPDMLNVDKINYSKDIEEKVKGISPSYTDICTTLVENWSALPANAVDANKSILNMTEQNLKQKYLLLSLDDSKFVNIPWWKKLFERGEYLLKHDAVYGTVNLIKKYKYDFSRFPLYADGELSKSLDIDELFQLKHILNDFGWVDDNSTSGSEIISIKAPLNLKGLVKNEEQMKQWGKDTLTIINTLTATPVPLEWSLFVPDEVKQVTMARNIGMNTALPLYRYIEFSTDNNTKQYKKFYSASDNTSRSVIAKDNAVTGDFIFNFYLSSDESTPHTSVKVNGQWSIIKLYLDANTVKESDKVYYIPIYVQDERGSVYVYYLGVEFNKPMPERQNWPNRYNMPDFS